MFTGFTPETVDFLWGIRMNNNREWFLAHKQQYVQTLYEPMKALGAELFQPFLDRPGNLLKVSRIYRDARLHHPLPYKESLWICIRQDVESWSEAPCLFFEITPDDIHYGFTLWRPKVTVMERFRQQITAQPEEFLNLLRNTQDLTGTPVTAQCYKRPKPAPQASLEPYFAWKGDISCIRREEFSPEVFGSQLSQRVGQFLEQLIPLYEYFQRISS